MSIAKNIHHMAWPANRYNHSVYRRFREHDAMKVIMPIDVHDELHANIPSNIFIPTRQIIGRAVLHLATFDLNDIEPIEVADEMADFMLDVGMTGLAQNLWSQMHYIEQGEYKQAR